MKKGLRLSERWFNRALWLVAFAFAWFLTGLGNTVVRDLPKVEQRQTIENFMDAQRLATLKSTIRKAEADERDASEALDQAELVHDTAKANNRAARETFSNWLATRRVTEQGAHDPELVRRTNELDTLRAAQRDALSGVQSQQKLVLDARQSRQAAEREMSQMREDASEAFQSARRSQELRVFGYRLALTLPLLVAAGYLFARKRKGPYWPFVWGFIFFAAFAFFVELVPYLPSYGGYVRYIVGILVTVIGGRYAIMALQSYLQRQREAEARPESDRRQALDYDKAQASLDKGVCPGCERTLAKKGEAIGVDFCPHCGMNLFHACQQCGTRRNSLSHFCHHCGDAGDDHGDAQPVAH
ncbi:zinc ribbon domain-containing protein [Hydrogenophaga sp. 5NK40-0174]|uniref:zinc ribbon domain-containing protein n=1 Tax=Hydrogenophaga sp. 5NK40-0174 TaxID=3127649 RepID=UPI0031069C03